MIFNEDRDKAKAIKAGKVLIALMLVLTVALSPVFIAPTEASDGQDVETMADSWRYQDGDVVADEEVEDLVPDTCGEEETYDVTEDYNAQMGSSIEEQQTADESAEEPSVEVTAEELVEETTEASAEEQIREQALSVEQETEAASAQTEEQEATEAAEEEIVTQESEETEEPAEIVPMSDTVKNKYWTWSSGSVKRGPGYLKGIDVSVWQGTIDWKEVKDAGIDYAILRCGYGSNSKSNDDSKFAANVAGCKKYGIPYGVYLYSYANTKAKASSEANHAIRLLNANNCKLDYPVYYDLEDKTVGSVSNATIRAMAKIFCDKLNNEGYAAGIYANLSWWNNKLTGLNSYDKWVAQWSSSCTYKKSYSMWQCSSKGKVSGVSGYVDANLLMCSKAAIDAYMKTAAVTYSFTTIDGEKYAISSRGTIVKNRFVKIGAYIYGFDAEGHMLSGKKYYLGYKGYILDSKGRAYINKSKTTKKAAYYTKKASGKKGTMKKGKKFYVLRTSGKWSQMANGYWVKTSLTKKTIVYPTIKPAVTVKYKAKLKKKSVSRSGPSTKYIKKKTFKKNKKVTVIGTYGSWAKVKTGQWLPLKKLRKL